MKFLLLSFTIVSGERNGKFGSPYKHIIFFRSIFKVGCVIFVKYYIKNVALLLLEAIPLKPNYGDLAEQSFLCRVHVVSKP